LPREFKGINPDVQARAVKAIDFDLGQEIAGIDQIDRIDFTCGFGRTRTKQGDERIVLVAAGAAAAFDRIDPGIDLFADDLALAAPSARQMQELELVVAKIDIQAGGLENAHGRIAVINDPDRAGQDVCTAKNRIAQDHRDRIQGIAQRDLQRLGLGISLDIGRRQPGQRRFAGKNPVAGITEIGDPGTIRPFELDCRRAKVRVAISRILLRNGVEREGPVFGVGIG